MISLLSGSHTILVSDAKFHPDILRGSPPPERRPQGSNKGWVGFSYFLDLSINITTTVADRAKVTIND